MIAVRQIENVVPDRMVEVGRFGCDRSWNVQNGAERIDADEVVSITPLS